MESRTSVAVVLSLLALSPMTFAQSTGGVGTNSSTAQANTSARIFGPLRYSRAAAAAYAAQHAAGNLSSQNTPIISANASANLPLQIVTNSYLTEGSGGSKYLPLWTYDVVSPRDGNHHQGTIVGHDPFKNPGIDKIPTFIVPLVIRTHSVATSIDPTTGIVSLAPGDATSDPTQPDSVCLSAPNDVPVKLADQSPAFVPTTFSMGGINVGTTQYLDAFQRGNFWNVLGAKRNQYHILLNPVRALEPIVIDVPSNEGYALMDPLFFGPPPICTPTIFIDINWFDSYIVGTVLPEVDKLGVDAGSLPIFLTYNAAWLYEPITNLSIPGAGGWHGNAGTPMGAQTYIVAEFDTSNAFVGPFPDNTETLTHELGEWLNDPYSLGGIVLGNGTPPWGPSGQVAGCQANMEIADPLTNTLLPPLVMPNGYGYLLQEMAFFSWFYGGTPTGVNGWYSNNGSFLTDAGPVCSAY